MFAAKLIEPELAFVLIKALSLTMIILGALKMVFYLFGEFKPELFANIKDGWLRKTITGKGNRLIFGLGGFVTAGLGGIFYGLGLLLESFSRRF